MDVLREQEITDGQLHLQRPKNCETRNDVGLLQCTCRTHGHRFFRKRGNYFSPVYMGQKKPLGGDVFGSHSLGGGEVKGGIFYSHIPVQIAS